MRRWLKANWRIVAAACVALILGGALGVAGGNGAKKRPVTVTAADVVTEMQATTVTSTRAITVTSDAPTRTVMAAGQTQTVTVRAASSVPAPSHSFSGRGMKNLGTVSVEGDSTLKWTHDGSMFQLSDESMTIDISSEGPLGEVAVPAGAYRYLTVLADGNWTVEIIPAS